MAVVRASGLGVSSASIAQHSPAYGRPVRSGQDTSASGTWLMPTRPPTAARMRRSLRHHARPSRYASLSSIDSPTASTARIWASRPSAGGDGA
jgi:hypothetical protein